MGGGARAASLPAVRTAVPITTYSIECSAQSCSPVRTSTPHDRVGPRVRPASSASRPAHASRTSFQASDRVSSSVTSRLPPRRPVRRLVADLVDRAAHDLRERPQAELVRRARSRSTERSDVNEPLPLAQAPLAPRRDAGPLRRVRGTCSGSSSDCASLSGLISIERLSSSAARASRAALRLGLAAQLPARRHPGPELERLALDRDAADLTLAKALDPIPVDARAGRGPRPARRARSSRASRVPVVRLARRSTLRARRASPASSLWAIASIEIARSAAIGAQPRRGEVEVLLG